MTESRNKPGVAFWATVVVVALLVGYPLSFGPACWWFGSGEQIPVFVGAGPLPKYAPRMYWPIGWLAANAPGPVGDAIYWYATFRSDRIELPADYSGQTWYGSDLQAYGRVLLGRE